VLGASVQIHAENAEKCYTTAFEDHWSSNPSGTVRNPAWRVLDLQELSFQSLPKPVIVFHPMRLRQCSTIFETPLLVYRAFMLTDPSGHRQRMTKKTHVQKRWPRTRYDLEPLRPEKTS
jgi:hypothetical protein